MADSVEETVARATMAQVNMNKAENSPSATVNHFRAIPRRPSERPQTMTLAEAQKGFGGDHAGA